MKTLIVRDNGDKLCPEPLINELCITLACATELGKAFLYEEGFDKKIYEITTPFRGVRNFGETFEVSDSSLGETFKARFTAYSIEISKNDNGVTQVEQTYTVERSLIR